ncbi:MAG: hypothetical protein KDA98_09515, partial [Acidimicrobiales bacterium]|nr:hypothetical protein [Acidimicrobiales bacterium]
MRSTPRSWTPRAAARSIVGLLLVAVALVGCTDDGGDDAGSARADQLAELRAVLPADVRGAFVADLGELRAGTSSTEVAAVIDGEVPGAGLLGPLADLGRLADQAGVDLDRVTTALVAHTADPAAGQVLVAEVDAEGIAEVTDGEAPPVAGTHGTADAELYEAGGTGRLALLPGGVLVVGTPTAVEAVVDVADGAASADDGAFGPYLDTLDGRSPLGFAYALPALDDDGIEPDRSLQGAQAVTGAIEVEDGAAGGTLAFHTADAEQFVEDYEALNRNATGGDDPIEEPLAVGDPVADDVGQVVVPLPTTPLDPSPEESLALRNLAKKLFVGMEAHDYAEGVAEGNPALVDLIVKSEEDGDEPPSPGSVFIRWRFRDQAAVEAFERDELPEGFRLAPTRFLETDDPEGELFLALNLYNSGGGSIVEGARAEWDVFVEPPEGADPDAGSRPRFMVIDALAQSVSADPVNLVTPAEPLSHQFVDGQVVSDVRRLAGDGDVPVFSSSFPVPDPAEAPVARFTREMAIGNDYIYWGHGVHDRVLYNATTFNHDAYQVDPATVTVDDASRWAQYLEPEIHDVVYYVNTLEYIASPLANLDSDLLDITPAWRAELQAFKDNGHQTGLMRAAVDQLFRGESDALVPRRIANETPSTTYHWEITDPEGLEAALDLPDGYRLAPTTVLEGGPEAHYLTLSVR